MSDASLARLNGWRPGTCLAGDEGHGETVIEITAVGERMVLAKAISHAGQPIVWPERSWTFSCRHWHEVHHCTNCLRFARTDTIPAQKIGTYPVPAFTVCGYCGHCEPIEEN